MTRIHKVFSLVLSLLCFSSHSQSATLQVPEDFSLQAALAAAAELDVISIAAGVHEVTPTLEIAVGSLTIIGRTGDPKEVILRPAGLGAGIFHTEATISVIIESLTLEGVRAAQQGAIYAESCSAFQIRNCIIRDNLSFLPGAVTLRDTYSTISDCTFTENSCVGIGAGLFLLETDTFANSVVVRDCLFRDNLASAGGAIGVIANIVAKNSPGKGIDPQEPTRFFLFDSRIESNTAQSPINGAGGGLMLLAAPQVPLAATLENVNFTRCAATHSGGALAIARGGGDVSVDLARCAFEENLASASHGGAIHVFDSFVDPPNPPPTNHRAILRIATCELVSNTATLNGGAISVNTGDHFTTLSVNGSEFRRNRARNGGAVCLGSNHPEQDVFEIENNVFTRNETSQGVEGTGGAVCLVGTHGQLRGNVFTRNFGNLGGGLALVGDGALVTENSFGTFEEIGNDATRGGGIYIRYEPILANRRPRITNNLILDNYAFQGGGGVYATTNGIFPEVAGFIGGNYFSKNFTANVAGEAALLEGNLGEEFVFAHNTVIDHASGGVFSKGEAPVAVKPSAIHLRQGAEPSLLNNLIANRNDLPVSGIFEEGDLQPTLLNNAFHHVSPIYIDNTDFPLTLAELNDLASADGNLETDPVFRPQGGLFTTYQNPHLEENSPLVGMAFPIDGLADDLPRDLDALLSPPGDDRVFGEGADIGADEAGPAPTPTPTPTIAIPGASGLALCFDSPPDGETVAEDDPPLGLLDTGSLTSGAQVGVPDPVSPQGGTALLLDGVDDHLVVPDTHGELSFPVLEEGSNGSFTLSAWVYLDAESYPLADPMTLCWKGIHNFNNHNYRLEIEIDGAFRMASGNQGGVSDFRSIPLRQWTHIAAHYDNVAKTIQYYLDFSPTAPIPAEFIGPVNAEPLYIGSRPQTLPSFYPFKGAIDKFRITGGLDPYVEERIVTPTATLTPTSTLEPTQTPTATEEVAASPSPTPEGLPTPTTTPVSESTPSDCDVVRGPVHPRCDSFDLLVLVSNLRGADTGIDTDFDENGNGPSDLFLFSLDWYRP
jgi:hypothetical protein